MKSPISDPMLSLAAKGLYAFFLEIGRVASVDEMSAVHPESKYSMTKAMKELKDARYIKAVRFQQNAGQWNTILKFTDNSLNLYVYETAGQTDTPNTSLLSTVSTNSHIANSLDIDTVTNVTVSIGAAPLKKEGSSKMAWPTFEGDTPAPKRKLSFNREPEDDDSGAVGKFVDKKAMRQEKYKKTSFEAVPATMLRHERPEEEWTTDDLVAEFYSLLRPIAKDAPGQVNGKHLITWINQRVGQGTPRHAVLKAIRMFFEDPRLTRDPGVGQSMLTRFFSYYTSVHGLVTKVKETKYVDEDFLAQQEKMLKMLEG